MSSLCCCWRPKAAEDEAAAAEMQEVEVARAGGGESGNNSAEGEAATEPGRLPHVRDAGPRQRRRSRTQLTKEQAGEEAWLLEPATSDEGASRQEAEGLQNSNCLGWNRKALEFYVDLLDRIDVFRATEANLPPLTISMGLCVLACRTWHDMRRRGAGFAAVSNCYVNTFIPDADTDGRTGEGRIIDCLTYWDLPHHRRMGVPAAAVHYWRTNGRYIARDTKTPWDPKQVDTNLKPRSAAWNDFEDSRQMFREILLDGTHTYVGLYCGKTAAGMRTGGRRFGVVAMFD